MLNLLSDSYSELEIISISDSGLSSCSILHFLPTTSTTNYYLKENVNDFDLRRLFYSRQDIKNICHSPAYTGHKRTNNTELIMKRDKEHVHKR